MVSPSHLMLRLAAHNGAPPAPTMAPVAGEVRVHRPLSTAARQMWSAQFTALVKGCNIPLLRDSFLVNLDTIFSGSELYMQQ